MMMKSRSMVIAVMVTFCMTLVLFSTKPINSAGPNDYDPWYDVNHDGKINLIDTFGVALKFGTSGTPLTQASMQYDSGWINVTDKCGQYNKSIMITHNLNIADWNDPNLMVDITGRTTPTSELLRFLGLEGRQGWSKTFAGPSDVTAYSIMQAFDGGYALAGYYRLSGREKAWLAKTDASGTLLWNKTYGGTGYDAAYSAVQTSDLGYALAGYTTSYGAGGDDFWLVKTDASGNALWNKTYGGTGEDCAYSVVQTSDGGYALAGKTNFTATGLYDYWLVKTDASGNMLWNNNYGMSGDEIAMSVVQTSDGGYAIAGPTDSLSGYVTAAWLVKTNAIGTVLWSATYGAQYCSNVPYSVIQTSDGGYALAGLTSSGVGGSDDMWLVKAAANGASQWSKTFGGPSIDFANCVVQTSEGGYALAGCTYSFGAVGSVDFWLVKTDVNGNGQWNETFGGTGIETAYSLVQSRDGSYVLAGRTNSFGAVHDEAYVVKTDTESGLSWISSGSNIITLYRGATDPYWNFVRVQIWHRR